MTPNPALASTGQRGSRGNTRARIATPVLRHWLAMTEQCSVRSAQGGRLIAAPTARTRSECLGIDTAQERREGSFDSPGRAKPGTSHASRASGCSLGMTALRAVRAAERLPLRRGRRPRRPARGGRLIAAPTARTGSLSGGTQCCRQCVSLPPGQGAPRRPFRRSPR